MYIYICVYIYIVFIWYMHILYLHGIYMYTYAIVDGGTRIQTHIHAYIYICICKYCLCACIKKKTYSDAPLMAPTFPGILWLLCNPCFDVRAAACGPLIFASFNISSVKSSLDTKRPDKLQGGRMWR